MCRVAKRVWSISEEIGKILLLPFDREISGILWQGSLLPYLDQQPPWMADERYKLCKKMIRYEKYDLMLEHFASQNHRWLRIFLMYILFWKRVSLRNKRKQRRKYILKQLIETILNAGYIGEPYRPFWFRNYCSFYGQQPDWTFFHHHHIIIISRCQLVIRLFYFFQQKY